MRRLWAEDQPDALKGSLLEYPEAEHSQACPWYPMTVNASIPTTSSWAMSGVLMGAGCWHLPAGQCFVQQWAIGVVGATVVVPRS